MNLKASLCTRTGAAIATAPVDFDEVVLMSSNDVSGIVASSSHAEFAMDKRVVVASGRFDQAPDVAGPVLECLVRGYTMTDVDA